MKYTIENPKIVLNYAYPRTKNFTGVVKDKYANMAYYNGGKLHREDGPAVIYSIGTKEWHIHGKLHRVDGPAIERYDGKKYWYINHKRHREDGPAIEHFGYTEWWYNHECYGRSNEFTVESWTNKWKFEIFK